MICEAAAIPVAVALLQSAGFSILEVAAAFDKSHAIRKASLAAAALVCFFCGAAAASCWWRCASSSAAAGSINASEGLFALGGMPDVDGDFILRALLGRLLAQVGLFFVLIRVTWEVPMVEAAAPALGTSTPSQSGGQDDLQGAPWKSLLTQPQQAAGTAAANETVLSSITQGGHSRPWWFLWKERQS